MLSFLCFYGNSSSTSAALGASATKKRSKPRCLLKLLRPPVQRWNKTNISLPINFTHEMHIQADGIPRLRETALDTLPGIQNSAHTYPVAEITTTGSTDLSVPGARGGCDVSTTEIPWSQRGIYHHRSPYRNTLRYTERVGIGLIRENFYADCCARVVIGLTRTTQMVKSGETDWMNTWR